MHVRNGSHKSMHNYNKILEEISDGLEVCRKSFPWKGKEHYCYNLLLLYSEQEQPGLLS